MVEFARDFPDRLADQATPIGEKTKGRASPCEAVDQPEIANDEETEAGG